MIKIIQIGSSLENEKQANDIDLLIIADKPVDIGIYTPDEWEKFKHTGINKLGRRIVIWPLEEKIFPLTYKELL